MCGDVSQVVFAVSHLSPRTFQRQGGGHHQEALAAGQEGEEKALCGHVLQEQAQEEGRGEEDQEETELSEQQGAVTRGLYDFYFH